jgi:decaprenylphospho-beta-D-ribofuranose 2-oxidase
MRTRLASFDGTEEVVGEFCRPDRYRHLFAALAGPGPAIARGAGLSYCAAGAGPDVRSVSALRFNRIRAFDGERGVVTVEAGIRLGELFRFTAPRGWVLPIMPGHPEITVGGCVGSNVHGKNHYHEGNFVNVVEELTLFHPEHGERICSRSERPGLFELTVGGFGLTGFVTSVTLRLRRLAGSAVRLGRQRCTDLVEAVELLERGRDADILYSWHNFNRRGTGFGAGFVYAGRYLDEERDREFRCRPLTSEDRGRWRVGPLAGWMTRTAARVYGWSQRLGKAEKVQDLASATFPINGKEVYFRLFGRAGFREYQVLLPRDRWRTAAGRLAGLIAEHDVPIGLASLKLFRGQGRYLRFDGSGVCLALDTPASERARELFAALDRLTEDLGGTVNVAKDSRLDAAFVRRVFPDFEGFKAALHAHDPKRRLDSALRRRLDV